MFQTKFVEKIKTHFMFRSVLSKILPFVRYCGKIWYRRTCHRWHCNAAHAPCI